MEKTGKPLKYSYNWNNSINSDPFSSPLEVAIIYYNPKYETHYNALNYRDGIAEVLFRIKIVSTALNRITRTRNSLKW